MQTGLLKLQTLQVLQNEIPKNLILIFILNLTVYYKGFTV